MVNLIVQAIIVLIVLGFAYWVWTKVRPIFAQFVAEPFMTLIDALLVILLGAIVVFWFLIPLVKMIPGAMKFGQVALSVLV